MKKKHHLVVDGSNIATEGRQLPSLAQLEEALEAFLSEHKFERVTVVVDATFGHRINAKERRWYEEAVAANRIITPPAGAIGRGDAFILEIAKRAGATILSNDSFQEFHGEHAWIFDEGRLYGGKPVPHVGWVFVARSPVRGPTSRRAVKKAKNGEQDDVTESTTTRTRAAASKSVAKDTTDTNATASSRRRTRQQTDDTAVADDTKRRDVSVTSRQPASTAQSADRVPPATGAKQDDAPSSDASGDKSTSVVSSVDKGRQQRSTRPAQRFNDPEKYERFRDAHPVGSLIEIVVERFSSHGAYARADDVEVYIPTKLLGSPPPQRARDVLHLGELVGLIVDRYDDETCAIDARAIRMDDDIAYYASARASTGMHESTRDESPIDSSDDDSTSREGSEQPTRRSEPVATKKAPAKKKAAAKKAPARKAAAKKAPAKKAPAKKAAAKKAPARKTAAKKAPAKKKATAKKAPVRKTAAKKAPAKKKATAKKAPVRKTAAKKAPAKKKATAKKAPAKKKATAKKAVKRTAKR